MANESLSSILKNYNQGGLVTPSSSRIADYKKVERGEMSEEDFKATHGSSTKKYEDDFLDNFGIDIINSEETEIFNEGKRYMKGLVKRKNYKDGGMVTDNVDVDPVSGNPVPPGSMPEEVRDDVPANLSEGEFVIPANVVQYYGVKYFNGLIEKAEEKLEDVPKGEPADDTERAMTDYNGGGLVSGRDNQHKPETWEDLVTITPRMQALAQGLESPSNNNREKLVLQNRFLAEVLKNQTDPDGQVYIPVFDREGNLTGVDARPFDTYYPFNFLDQDRAAFADNRMGGQSGQLNRSDVEDRPEELLLYEAMEQYQTKRPQQEKRGYNQGGMVTNATTVKPATAAPIQPQTQPTQTGATYKTYYGPSGQTLEIMFINGEPQQPIPMGYTANPPSETPQEGETSYRPGTSNAAREREMRTRASTMEDVQRERSMLEDLNYNDRDSVMSWARERISTPDNNSPGLIGRFLPGGLIGLAKEASGVAQVNAASRIARQMGNEDLANELATQARDSRSGALSILPQEWYDGDQIAARVDMDRARATDTGRRMADTVMSNVEEVSGALDNYVDRTRDPEDEYTASLA